MVVGVTSLSCVHDLTRLILLKQRMYNISTPFRVNFGCRQRTGKLMQGDFLTHSVTSPMDLLLVVY